VAFDLDGTLVDSRRDLAESANALVAELGGQVLTEDAIGRMVGEGAGLLVRRALAAAGLDEHHPGALARFLDIYDRRLLNHTRLYPGILDAVRRAKACARVTVLTNKPLGPTRRILQALALDGLFDEVVGGDGPLPRKPDPAALLAMMATAGAQGTHTLLVGDSAFDRETARRAGAKCCLVSYGFGFHTVAEGVNGSPAPDEWIVPDTVALAEAIERFLALRDG
jgi:phosphoglycolate phosphatase